MLLRFFDSSENDRLFRKRFFESHTSHSLKTRKFGKGTRRKMIYREWYSLVSLLQLPQGIDMWKKDDWKPQYLICAKDDVLGLTIDSFITLLTRLAMNNAVISPIIDLTAFSANKLHHSVD